MPTFSRPSPKNVVAQHLSRRGQVRTAGEVRFIKDRGGDRNEWAWNMPGPMERQIDEDFIFDPRYLKPLAATLRASLMAMGHAISAHDIFAKIKSADVSPDGNLGGKGYIQKITDIRRSLMNVVESLSAATDTLYDEIKAPHWHPTEDKIGPRERNEVREIVQDAEAIRHDPEGWAAEEEEEGVDEEKIEKIEKMAAWKMESDDVDPLP